MGFFVFKYFQKQYIDDGLKIYICMYVCIHKMKDEKRIEGWEEEVNKENKWDTLELVSFSIENYASSISILPKTSPQPWLLVIPLLPYYSYYYKFPLVRVFTVTLILSVNERWLHCCWAATSFSIMFNCSGVSWWEGLGGCGGFGRTTTVRAWSSSCFFSFFSRICSSDRTSTIGTARDQS